MANGILNEAVLFGTGTAANIGRPQIGKTGTAMDHSDAWFVGAIPQMVASVWIGYPQGQIRMEPPGPGSRCTAGPGRRRSGAS